ncbi:MAG TPA: hypothetical protein VLH79_07630 [Chthonomonadales bacterium]|nr:hypothetical protein [Chthonomonadales bacterium]
MMEEELDRVRREAEEARAAAHEAELRAEIGRQARRLNVVDEDAARRLLDASGLGPGSDLPARVEAALLGLLSAKPYLAGWSVAGSAANPPREESRRLGRDELRRMTPEQINANWEAVQRALRAL